MRGGNLERSRYRACLCAFAVPSSQTPPITATDPPPGSPIWYRACWRRIRHLFVLKTLGITGFMWIFFLGYFHLLRHPAKPVIEMPLVALDHWVTFQPLSLPAYVSLWVYVGLPAGLMQNLRQLVVYGFWVGLLCLLGLACFYLVPTAIPAAQVPSDIALQSGFALLQGVDAAGNACPSLHVATAVFSAIWLHRLMKTVAAPVWTRVVNALWAALIVWSTLATKQHVALDVLAGTLLAVLVALPSLRWFDRMAAVRPTSE